MSLFEPAPEPPTSLGRYRVLSKTAGIRVSPLQLGAMSLGEAWKGMLGSMDKKGTFELLDAFVAAGGNFIDTLVLQMPADHGIRTDRKTVPTTTRTMNPSFGLASG
jgi:hypothetical protein